MIDSSTAHDDFFPAIGMRDINPDEPAVADTMASFDTYKQRQLDETIDRLRARYGRKVVFRHRAGEPGNRADAHQLHPHPGFGVGAELMAGSFLFSLSINPHQKALIKLVFSAS